MANANRISNDFDDRIVESRRHFEREVTDSFDAIISAAEEGLKKAQFATEKGATAIEKRVQEIKLLLARIENAGTEES